MSNSTSRKSTSRKTVRFSRAPKATVALIKRVVKGQAETKMATWYNGSQGTGLLAQASLVGQNQFISNNGTDILQIIPEITQGVNDNQRVGQAIQPISCKVHCKVSLLQVQGVEQGTAFDLVAVAYCLQHVSYKTYAALKANNQFTQLLEVGDGTTVNFEGSYEASTMPVAKGYYKLLGKKKMYLRSSGLFNNSGGTIYGNQNSHPPTHEWTWELKRHLPKKIQYPENDQVTVGVSNLPTNAAPFWCVGYYTTDGTAAFPTTARVWIQQQYVTQLRYKDM